MASVNSNPSGRFTNLCVGFSSLYSIISWKQKANEAYTHSHTYIYTRLLQKLNSLNFIFVYYLHVYTARHIFQFGVQFGYEYVPARTFANIDASIFALCLRINVRIRQCRWHVVILLRCRRKYRWLTSKNHTLFYLSRWEMCVCLYLYRNFENCILNNLLIWYGYYLFPTDLVNLFIETPRELNSSKA